MYFTVLSLISVTIVYLLCSCNIITVPTPTVSVTALSNQTVGQSLTLQCEVTTVRGITSRVDIVWSSGGTVLQRMNNVSSTMMSNSLVYTNSYTISQLSTTDDGRVIQCEVVINADQSVMANNSITLDVTGKFIVNCACYECNPNIQHELINVCNISIMQQILTQSSIIIISWHVIKVYYQ